MNYKPVLIDLGSGLVPLLNATGNPVIYDADTYPDGPPEGCCCEAPTCCWDTFEERPATLTATLDVDGCCADGVTATLTQPAGTVPDCLIRYTINPPVSLSCIFGGSTALSIILCCLATPVDGKQWRVVVQIGPTPLCSPSFTGYANVDSCDPFSITFTGVLSAGPMCPECVNGTPITVTITE